MVRWSLIGVLALCAVLAAVYPATRAATTSSRSQRDEARERDRARFIALAEAMNLSWITDGQARTVGRKLILSDFPTSFERSVRLSINYPAFDRWQGTVAIYLGEARMWAANHDAQHPERSAILGDSFVYGDPELIERLRAEVP